ncbi:MAG TPA: PqqD family protein [Chloroflexota bacterium]|nr:PqqD family protein [Chloroflexota bacterium]
MSYRTDQDHDGGGAAATGFLRPNPEVIGRRMGDEYVLIHLATNQVYALNQTATRLWELLGEGYGRAALQERLLDEFDVDAATLADEIDQLLAVLRAHQLVGDVNSA